MARLPKLCAQAAVLPGESEAGPFGGSRPRKRGCAGLSTEDGQRRSASAVPPPWKSGGILPRVDQKQVGSATVSRSRVGQGANGVAVGLPHLQLATLDSPKQAPRNTSGCLKEQESTKEEPRHCSEIASQQSRKLPLNTECP